MSRKQIVTLFCLAAVIRLAYVGLVAAFGGDFANGSDSGKFLKRALNLLEYGEIVYLDYGVLISDTARMPIYPYFLAGILSLSGEGYLWLVGTIQAFIDASTVIAIGLAAAAIDKRWAVPAAILGCLWATLIVYSSYVLSDTLFMSFFCWGLCACLWAPKKPQPLILLCLAGLAFSCTLLTRPTLLFFPYLILPIIAYLLLTVSKIKWYRALILASIPSACLILVIVPRIVSINNDYGMAVVTTQTGNHAIDVVAQFLRKCPSCVSSNIENQMYRKLEIELTGLQQNDRRNPVIVDQIRRSVAFEFLKKVPMSSVILGTTTAALRSFIQTGLYETGHQMKWDPLYFSLAAGDTLGSKTSSFLNIVRADRFLTVWLMAQVVAVIAFSMQILGTGIGIRSKLYRPYIITLLCVAGYFLALNGPFGNPRYGMPLSPVLIILTTCGLMKLKELYPSKLTQWVAIKARLGLR